MRIGIDGRPLQGNRTGVGRYVFELCRALDELLPEATFFVYSQVPLEMPVQSPRWKLRLEPSAAARRLKSVLWIKLRAGLLCEQDELDVFWGGASFLPRLPVGVRSVVTVHDMNHVVCPSAMSSTHLWAYRLFFRRDVLRADAVITNSHGTAKRLLEGVGRHTDTVVSPAVDSRFTTASRSEVFRCLHRHGIDAPYLLAVATWEPRKNLELLIDTFLQMKKAGLLPAHKLVLAGGKGWKDERLAKLINAEKHDLVLPLGYLNDEDLISLYSGCDLFVFPSLYEGFGIPVLEARACGARVVATDIPELREAGGKESVYVQADMRGLREGILNAIATRDCATRSPLPLWKSEAQKMVKVLSK